jgi:hypothetical protein
MVELLNILLKYIVMHLTNPYFLHPITGINHILKSHLNLGSWTYSRGAYCSYIGKTKYDHKKYDPFVMLN